MTNTFGGAQENAGRPHLDGSPAGEGEYAVRLQATVTPAQAEYVDGLEGDNTSAKIRMLIDEHKARADALARLVEATAAGEGGSFTHTYTFDTESAPGSATAPRSLKSREQYWAEIDDLAGIVDAEANNPEESPRPPRQCDHCWHAFGGQMLSNPIKQKEVCCHCGETRTTTMGERSAPRRHGPYYTP